MSARRCSPCNRNYPSYSQYEVCPVCYGDTWYDAHASMDDDWRETAEADKATGRRSQSSSELAGLYPHRPDVAVTVYEAYDRKFILHQDLLDAGYLYLETFSIVYVNETFFELQGHSRSGYRLTGDYHPAGLWWVEEVPETLDLPVTEAKEGLPAQGAAGR